MAKRKDDLSEQARKILELAEERGIQSNFFFRTTFERYLVQMEILEDLRDAIQEFGTTTTKEYIKGKENLTTNPAITEYNRTTSSANRTVTTLISIVKSFAKEDDDGGKLEDFLSALNG